MPLLDLFRRRRSTNPSDLALFLQAQSAYVAQKTVLDYCRVKSGRNEKLMFSDPDFQAALTHCRWQVFFAALSDVTALIEAHLRAHAPNQEVLLSQRLVRLHQTALAHEAPPAEEAPSAADAQNSLAHHLTVLQLEAPHSAHRLPLLAEAVLFATIPIHADQRRGETIAIKGALRFQIVTTQQELERRFEPEMTTRNLLNL